MLSSPRGRLPESLVQEAENELEVHFQHGMMNLATESEIDSANFVMI